MFNPFSNPARVLIALLAAALLTLSGCGRPPAVVNEVVAVRAAQLPLDPADASWDQAPEHTAKLLLQDLVEPRLMKPSTADVRVRSLTNGAEIAFRLTWTDPVKDDMPGPAKFQDACAIQIPKQLAAQPPDPQMGQAGRTVDINYWRADWQASVDGRGDTIKDLYPNASIDHYPFEAAALEKGSDAQKEMSRRYSPADASGNRRAGPRATPVEHLIAEGPGTLSPGAADGSKGRGIRTATGWSVVIVRKSPEGLAPKNRSQIAFAIWEGGQGEVGARKMRSGWAPLAVRE